MSFFPISRKHFFVISVSSHTLIVFFSKSPCFLTNFRSEDLLIYFSVLESWGISPVFAVVSSGDALAMSWQTQRAASRYAAQFLVAWRYFPHGKSPFLIGGYMIRLPFMVGIFQLVMSFFFVSCWLGTLSRMGPPDTGAWGAKEGLSEAPLPTRDLKTA